MINYFQFVRFTNFRQHKKIPGVRPPSKNVGRHRESAEKKGQEVHKNRW